MHKQCVPGSLFPRPPRAWVRGYALMKLLRSIHLQLYCQYSTAQNLKNLLHHYM